MGAAWLSNEKLTRKRYRIGEVMISQECRGTKHTEAEIQTSHQAHEAEIQTSFLRIAS